MKSVVTQKGIFLAKINLIYLVFGVLCLAIYTSTAIQHYEMRSTHKHWEKLLTRVDVNESDAADVDTHNGSNGYEILSIWYVPALI